VEIQVQLVTIVVRVEKAEEEEEVA